MNPTLDQLVLLQAIDLEIRHARADLAEAPRRVARAEAERAQAESTLAALRESLAREEALRRRQESDADDRRTKIVRLRRQMESATSAAQIAALEHEISFAEAAIRKLEDEELASLERTESAETEQHDAAALLERRTASLATERTRSAETTARAQALLGEREVERKALRAAIEAADDGVLRTYDRISKGRGTGLSEAVDHKCSACQMMVRPQRWNDLTGREHADQIFTCETCGRVLFWDPRRDSPGVWAAGDRLAAARLEEARGVAP